MAVDLKKSAGLEKLGISPSICKRIATGPVSPGVVEGSSPSRSQPVMAVKRTMTGKRFRKNSLGILRSSD
jgi:hypothetical protein